MNSSTTARPAKHAGIPNDIRNEGWSVAVHNDYRQGGVPHTFWLFTKNDTCVKGEGQTDGQALNQIRLAIGLESVTSPSCGFVPPTPGYAGCTRSFGHDGPCAHHYIGEAPQPTNQELDLQAMQALRNLQEQPLDFDDIARLCHIPPVVWGGTHPVGSDAPKPPVYGYSVDQEIYHGSFTTVEEACQEAWDSGGVEVGGHVWVGVQVAPTQPETYFNILSVDQWLENVSEQNEYAGQHAEGWDSSTCDQQRELAAEVQQVMAAWLDRHNLRPKFWGVGSVQKFVLVSVATEDNKATFAEVKKSTGADEGAA